MANALVTSIRYATDICGCMCVNRKQKAVAFPQNPRH